MLPRRCFEWLRNEQTARVTSENARTAAGEGRFTAGHDPITGKPITKNVLARTQAECKKKLREELNKAEVLDYTKADKITVGAWLDTWYEN